MSPDSRAALERALTHARHVVPAQSPLDRFVHHNPLHMLETRPFGEAVRVAAKTYGTEPYWPEHEYLRAFARGRIRRVDVDAAITKGVAIQEVSGIIDRRGLTAARMLHPLEPLCGAALRWHLSETEALTRVRGDLTIEARSSLLASAGGDEARALQELWNVSSTLGPRLASQPSHPAARGPRIRDILFAHLREDTDALVNPVLIRWAAAYLDHGVARWPMDREQGGFLPSVLRYLGEGTGVGRPWLGEFATLARQARDGKWTWEALCLLLLQRLGHSPESWTPVVEQSLLALGGWAGMFQRLADRPDTAPAPVVIAPELRDFLAVRLALDYSAAAWMMRDLPGGTLLDKCTELPPVQSGATPTIDPAWECFQLAQILGLCGHKLQEMGQARVRQLIDAARECTDIQRRELWHAAYERRFQTTQLDALGTHAMRRIDVASVPVRAHCTFCIDDREESIRRHLEETAPWIQTIGAAGNFGISMYYKGLEHGKYVALGPAGFEPRNRIEEHALRSEREPARSRWSGLLRHKLDTGSQTLLGGLALALGGFISAVPMSVRLLAPKLHARLTRRDLPAETRLQLEPKVDGPDDAGVRSGFSVGEMVASVKESLDFMSLHSGFAPLVLMIGHGSRTANNPHASAYNCGACAGGKGGPNARAIAHMANDSRVREALVAKGIVIPQETWFVGGFHNTAADTIELYDLDIVPAEHGPLLAEVRAAFDTALALDALERCRKFENISLEATPAAALNEVQNRCEDLAQPRPEYNHSSNALCLVGRRHWSRGLFLDRRAFLCSYDPAEDPDGSILTRLLAMAVPVGAGINLEYWFSSVDPNRYGCGTKLPHNVTGLLGVMDGHQSDLRTGLASQMVELHEPVRLLCVVEASPERLKRVAASTPSVGNLVANNWVTLASLDPATGAISRFDGEQFQPWEPEDPRLPRVASSRAWFSGTRGYLPPASIEEVTK